MDPSDSYLQAADAANRIGWANVNGVTSPNVLQELNVKNTGPQFFPAHAVGEVQLEAAFHVDDANGYEIPAGVPGAWLDDQVLITSYFHNLPFPRDSNSESEFGHNSTFSDIFGIEVYKKNVFQFRTFTLPKTESFITMKLNFTGTTHQTFRLFIEFDALPGNFQVSKL